MNSFWPQLPYFIPKSPGMPIGFDTFWWVYQIVVMAGALLLLRKLGITVDEDRQSDTDARLSKALKGRKMPADDGTAPSMKG